MKKRYIESYDKRYTGSYELIIYTGYTNVKTACYLTLEDKSRVYHYLRFFIPKELDAKNAIKNFISKIHVHPLKVKKDQTLYYRDAREFENIIQKFLKKIEQETKLSPNCYIDEDKSNYSFGFIMLQPIAYCCGTLTDNDGTYKMIQLKNSLIRII